MPTALLSVYDKSGIIEFAEALHELGHTFGLHHCRRPDCVMRASTNADDVVVDAEGKPVESGE